MFRTAGNFELYKIVDFSFNRLKVRTTLSYNSGKIWKILEYNTDVLMNYKVLACEYLFGLHLYFYIFKATVSTMFWIYFLGLKKDLNAVNIFILIR